MRSVLLGVLLLAAACSTPASYGYREVEVRSWSSESYSALLARYVTEGRVDYDRWHASTADVNALDDYLNLVANASPDSRPDLFPAPRDGLAYWMNAYNALVIRSILEHWPVESVNDVRAGISFLKGKGFFANRKFQVGRAWMSLDEIEAKLRKMKDPRMHFAINCGSGGCPKLDATAFAGDDIDKMLDRKARAFVNDPKNVRFTAKTVELSQIFEWYEEDFLATMPEGSTILDYILQFVDDGPLAAALLGMIRAGGFKVHYIEYDWSVNKK